MTLNDSNGRGATDADPPPTPRHATTTLHLGSVPRDSPAARCSLCGRRAGRSARVSAELPRLHTVCRSYMLTRDKPPQEHVPPRGQAA